MKPLSSGLTLLRKTIKDNDGAFPYRQILDRMVSRGKSLKCENEEIETLVELPYKDKRIFSMLSLMFPFIDLKNNHFHIDHVYPSSLFTKLCVKLRTSSPYAIASDCKLRSQLIFLQIRNHWLIIRVAVRTIKYRRMPRN